MPIVKPWIAVRPDNEYKVYDKIKGTDMVIKASKSMEEDLIGRIFANDAVWMDFFNADAVTLWGKLLKKFYLEVFFDGVWLG